MRKALVLCVLGLVGSALSVNREVARVLLKRYNALRQEYLRANKVAEAAMLKFSESLLDLFWVDIGLQDRVMKNRLEALAEKLDLAQHEAWNNYVAINYSDTALELRDLLRELAGEEGAHF